MLLDIIFLLLNILNIICVCLSLSIIYYDQIRPRLNKTFNILFLFSFFSLILLSLYLFPDITKDIIFKILYVFKFINVLFFILGLISIINEKKYLIYKSKNSIDEIKDD